MTTENVTTTTVSDVLKNLTTTTVSATTGSRTDPITSSVPSTTLQTNVTSMMYPRETTKPTSNKGLSVGLGIGISAAAIIVIGIALIAWRRKRNRKKENRQAPNLPTASEVDRVIIAESKKEKKGKKKRFKMPHLSFTNTAHENELSSSTTTPDYVNVNKKKEPFYANADTKVVDQPEYIDPLPDDKTIYTGAESGVTYYMDNKVSNTATPRPKTRTGDKPKEVIQDDYEEVITSDKKTKPIGNNRDRGDPTLLGKDYVNVRNMKKPK